MNSDELGSLHDIYQTLQPNHKAQKASSFFGDTQSQISTCLVHITLALVEFVEKQSSSCQPFMRQCTFFQLYGFITKVIVCDGASNNLAAIKTLTGFGSAWSVRK